MQALIRNTLSALLFLTHASAFAAPTKLLLTTFEPFNKRPFNVTQQVVPLVKQQLEKQFGKNIEIKVCDLPVLFDKAAEVAIKCIEDAHFQPDLVLSTGEGGGIYFESSTHNEDWSPATMWVGVNFKDNAGIERNRTPIINGGQDDYGFTWPVADMYCSVDSSVKDFLFVSKSMYNAIDTSIRGYVCNNLSYHLSKYFGERHIPFTFMHVPALANECKSPGCFDVAASAGVVAKAIATVVQKRNSISPDQQAGLFQPQPFTKSDTLVAKQRAEAANQKCQADYYQRVYRRYEIDLRKPMDESRASAR